MDGVIDREEMREKLKNELNKSGENEDDGV